MILETAALISLLSTCQTSVDPITLQTIVNVESAKNPYAIAVVNGKSIYPKSEMEAVNTIKELDKKGLNYSVGIMQVNQSNFKKYGLTLDSAFNSCKNIQAGAEIFKNCYFRAKNKFKNLDEQQLIRKASSCYYSGNFTRGYKKEKSDNKSYVERINEKVPRIKPIENKESKPVIKGKAKNWDVFSELS